MACFDVRLTFENVALVTAIQAVETNWWKNPQH